MIHVFRENEEQLFRVSPGVSRRSESQRSKGEAGWAAASAPKGKRAVWGRAGAAVPDPCASAPQMIRMSTGHMEGNLQLLYVLLTDCYVYLLRKGACRPQARPGQLPRARGG